MLTKWVLIDETNGAKTGDGSTLDPATLTRIAVCVQEQLNQEFSVFYGGQYQVRVGANSQDIQPGEQVYSFVPTLAQAPGASAYHDIDGKGVPVAYCAVTTCGSLLGPNGISVDASHELLEAAADPSCNIMADNLQGLLIAYEVGDPVEVQTYASHVDAGVEVSNFVLPSWFDPKAAAPYDFMTYAKIPGSVAPPGPLQLAPGNGGNYIITESSTENQTDTFGIKGTPKKARQDTASRFMRRLMGRQVSQRGKMAFGVITPQNPIDPTVEVNEEENSVTVTLSTAPVTHIPPGTVERTSRKTAGDAAKLDSPLNRVPARPIPVSVQRGLAFAATKTPQPVLPQVGSPTELTTAASNAAQRLTTRAQSRANYKPSSGQHDPQQAVLAGRRQIRNGK